jgi:hypothetical protein
MSLSSLRTLAPSTPSNLWDGLQMCRIWHNIIENLTQVIVNSETVYCNLFNTEQKIRIDAFDLVPHSKPDSKVHHRLATHRKSQRTRHTDFPEFSIVCLLRLPDRKQAPFGHQIATSSGVLITVIMSQNISIPAHDPPSRAPTKVVFESCVL